jgi:predicted esterase
MHRRAAPTPFPALRPWVLAAGVVVAACGSDGTPGTSPAPPSASEGVESIFVVPGALDELAAERFHDHPWPSDLRRDPDGSIRLTGFYNPNATGLINTYVAESKGLVKGFSTVASGYMRFAGAIDAKSLPAGPKDTLAQQASVQIVDVDPKSPERGTRRLAQTHLRTPAGVFWLENTLAVMPALGWPLRPKTRYATVVTRAVKDAQGRAVRPSADLREVLALTAATPRTQAARDLYGPAIDELAKAGVPREEIAHLAVFTTDDPTEELFKVVDDVRTRPPPEVRPASWAQKERTSQYDVYEGAYGPSPDYQAGKLPFQNDGDGGGFAFDAAGKPVVQRELDLRFTLAIPTASHCKMPADGFPLVIYAHGTGGDYRSVVSEPSSVGVALSERCLASMGTDQIFHGARPGAPIVPLLVQILFFNFNNLIAARTNGRQAAVDVVQQARLFKQPAPFTVPASVSRSQTEIKIDGSKILFVGHSQGGLNGSLYLASDDSARGGVLSGSGSLIMVALLEKSQPQPSVSGLVKTFLGLTGDAASELNLFHPALNLAQILVDPVDPVQYMGYLVRHPRAGFAPKSVLQTEGIEPSGVGDSYSPPHGIEIGAVAAGLPRLLPGVRPVEEAAWGGLDDVKLDPRVGLAKNLAGGRATGALSQWMPARGSDGHFVIFDVGGATSQMTGFCRELADDPAGRIPPP